jgi:molybdopterin/thiamine biosynthesis adenylyltransferase
MSEIYVRQEAIKLNKVGSIAVVGCGGIGFWVAKFAAMSGIEKIVLYDPDVFEEHNLNRIDIPLEALGHNKAQVTKTVVEELRPDCDVKAFPFPLREHLFQRVDWLIDCTDKLDSQTENQRIAHATGSKYVKAGYNGTSVTISNSVAEWGEAPDGYTIIPSWIVPAATIAALTVGKIMKYDNGEIACDLKDFYRYF